MCKFISLVVILSPPYNFVILSAEGAKDLVFSRFFGFALLSLRMTRIIASVPTGRA